MGERLAKTARQNLSPPEPPEEIGVARASRPELKITGSRGGEGFALRLRSYPPASLLRLPRRK